MRIAAGSLAGAAIAAAIAPFLKPLFHAPAYGVGWVTVNHYPKSWDYAVIALLILGAFAGGVIARGNVVIEGAGKKRGVIVAALVVFVLMLFVHDHPYAPMEPFHEGEHLTAGSLMKAGARPYKDFYIFHGLAVDAGLDALVLGDPPSPLHSRRLQTFLDAATLALLVPIAAEVTATTAGMLIAVLVSL